STEAWWSASARCGNAGTTEDATYSRARKLDAFLLGKHLRKVLLVEALVSSPCQSYNPPLGLLDDGVVGGSTAVAADKRIGALIAIATAQSPHLALGDA